MIRRGMHHVLHDRTELMQRIKDPTTIDALEALMNYYEARDHRKKLQEGGCHDEAVKEFEKQALLELINKTGEWLRLSNAKKGIASGKAGTKS
jgi:hypothetical protein